MLWLWLCAGLIVLVLCIVALMGYVEIKGVHVFRAEHRNVHYEIKGLFGLLRLKINVPMFKFKGFHEGFAVDAKVNTGIGHSGITDVKEELTLDKVVDIYRNTKLLIRHVDGFTAWLSASLARINCSQLRWNTRIGTGDAPSTAVLSGMVWGLKSTLVGFLAQQIRFVATPQFKVVPQYNDEHFSTELIIFMSVRHVQLLLMIWFLLLRIYRVKGGLKVWWSSLLSFYKKAREM